MKSFILVAAAAGALMLAACGEGVEPSAAGSPSTASAGGGTSGPTAEPKGEQVPLPEASPGTASETKPDPGDANDHSNPQHDSRNKKGGD